MAPLTIALALLALLGHAALWVGFVNRIHATGFPRIAVKLFSSSGHFLLVALPLAAIGCWWFSDQSLIPWLDETAARPIVWPYLILCWAVAILAIALWTRRRFSSSSARTIISRRATTLDIAARLGFKPLNGSLARILSFVPGNQALQVSIEELELALPRMPPQLDGLSLVQLTDFHFTGQIGIDFFKEVVRQSNALRPDMVVITGDIVDEIELFNWIPEMLAQLSAPLGVYFVLGNHDQFTHQASRLRQTLTDVGFVDLGGRWLRLEHSGVEIILAGNELPWFSPAPEMPPRGPNQPQLRLLLSHSPDQFAWARRNDFNLMLAGHAHGGQIQLPLIGPIFCPSRHGVKYACGTFYAPPTVLHVSRGLSSELPLRLHCPPELTKIVLRAAAAS